MENILADPGGEVFLRVLEGLVEDVDVMVEGWEFGVLVVDCLHVGVDVNGVVAFDEVEVEETFK